jgi:hypothetical protein
MKQKFKIAFSKIHLLVEEFFQYSLLTYLILVFVELLKTGEVSFFINIYIILVLVLISGLIMILTHNKYLEPEKVKKHIKQVDIEHFILIAATGGVLIYLKMAELGISAIIIAFLAALFIFVTSIIIFVDST